MGKARTQILLCRERLAAHEFLIGRFYYQKKSYMAAADRFRVVLDKYPYYSRTDEALYLLGSCLVFTDNPDEARLYFERLIHEYPQGKLTRQAKEILRKQAKE